MIAEPIVRLMILAAVFLCAGGAGVGLRRYFAGAELPKRFDRKDVDLAHDGPMLVEFTSPFCYECQLALPVLEAASLDLGAPLAVVNAKDRPDLTVKYAIRTTPTILVVDGGGKVTRGWMDTAPTAQDLTEALSLANA